MSGFYTTLSRPEIVIYTKHPMERPFFLDKTKIDAIHAITVQSKRLKALQSVSNLSKEHNMSW
jgi:hypothetical protein